MFRRDRERLREEEEGLPILLSLSLSSLQFFLPTEGKQRKPALLDQDTKMSDYLVASVVKREA